MKKNFQDTNRTSLMPPCIFMIIINHHQHHHHHFMPYKCKSKIFFSTDACPGMRTMIIDAMMPIRQSPPYQKNSPWKNCTNLFVTRQAVKSSHHPFESAVAFMSSTLPPLLPPVDRLGLVPLFLLALVFSSVTIDLLVAFLD